MKRSLRNKGTSFSAASVAAFALMAAPLSAQRVQNIALVNTAYDRVEAPAVRSGYITDPDAVPEALFPAVPNYERQHPIDSTNSVFERYFMNDGRFAWLEDDLTQTARRPEQRVVSAFRCGRLVSMTNVPANPLTHEPEHTAPVYEQDQYPSVVRLYLFSSDENQAQVGRVSETRTYHVNPSTGRVLSIDVTKGLDGLVSDSVAASVSCGTR